MIHYGHFLNTDGPGVVGLTVGIFSTLMVLELYDSLWAFSPFVGPGLVRLTVGIFSTLLVLELYD